MRRPLAILLVSTLASGARITDLGRARAWKEERHAKALFEDRYGPVRVLRRLRPTKVVRPSPSFIFLSAVLVVRHGNETGLLKLRSVPGDRDTWHGMEVQRRAAAVGLAPRVFAIEVLERSPGQTTFGALSELLDGYASMEDMSKLEPVHFKRAGEALSRLHALGIRHGDMHPGNLMFRGRDVKIIDFDSARPTDADPCEGWENDPWRECDDFIRLGAWDVAKLSAGTNMTTRAAWHAAVAYMGPRIAAHWSMRQDCVANGRCPPRRSGPFDLNFLRESKPLVPARRVAPRVARRRGVVLGAGEAKARQQRYIRRFEAVHGSVDVVRHLAGPRAIKLYRRRLEPNGAVYTRSILLVRRGVLKVATVHGKRDVWPEWEAQAEVHAAAPDLAPRTMGYVAIDDADQPTTTFVGLSERVEGTPLSELAMLRPRHLSLASAALDRLHRLGFRHGDGHLGNFILGNDGITMIDFEQAARNASCARDGCADQIFLAKADVEHLRNGTSLSMKEAWRSAGAALGARRGAHSSLRRFFLDEARKARTSHIT